MTKAPNRKDIVDVPAVLNASKTFSSDFLFICDECAIEAGARTGYYAPSFLVEAYSLMAKEQNTITSEIKSHYIGSGSLTQKKMGAFFANEGNFAADFSAGSHEDFCR